MRMLLSIMAAGLLLTSAPALAAGTPTPEQAALIRKYQAILDGLHPVFGDVRVDRADALLHLGRAYYFLPAEEAKRVLVEGWGNPPDSVGDVLGMIFPAGTTFVDDGWGAVITWLPTGYVSDVDAKSADYSAVIRDAQDQERELNEERVKQGFAAQHLVGWAQPPTYDAKNHSMIWAQDIKFGDNAEDTLNYDVRMLGRNGVLSINIVSAMSHLRQIRPAAATLARTAEYEKGFRYADYVPDVDKKAEFGLAGLVAAGVGVAAAKKLGLLALFAVFAKKFFVLALALFAGVAGWLRRAFRKDKTGE